MTQRIELCVLGTPVAKQAMRVGKTRHGHVVTYQSAKVKQAEQSFLAQILPQKPPKPHDGPLRVFLSCFFRVPKSWPKKRQAAALAGEHTQRPDLDNLSKLALDALKGVFFVDDCQVTSLVAQKSWGALDMTLVVLELEDPREAGEEGRP